MLASVMDMVGRHKAREVHLPVFHFYSSCIEIIWYMLVVIMTFWWSNVEGQYRIQGKTMVLVTSNIYPTFSVVMISEIPIKKSIA